MSLKAPAIVTTLLFLSLLVCSTSASAYQTRIIGGHTAEKSSWNSVVALELTLSNGTKRLCAGNLISSQWVLSAAHCFYDNHNQQEVFAADVIAYPGLHSLSQRSYQNSSDVQNIYIHPQYALTSPFDYDFALLELAHPVDVPVAPISLNSPEDGELTTVIGWGIQQLDPVSKPPLGSSVANQIQEVEVPTVSNSTCSSTMGRGITDSMLCAGYVEGGKDACSGDSGGPMMVLRNGVYTQVGLVSFGVGCAQPNRFGVYARMTAGLPWISELVTDMDLSDSVTAERKIDNERAALAATNIQGDEGLEPQARQGGGAFSILELLVLLLMFNLEKSVGSRKSTQSIDAPGKS